MNETPKIPKINNRDDRRKYSKALQKSGKSKKEADKVVKIFSDYHKALSNNGEGLPNYKCYLLEGEKVKLNLQRIKAHPDWERLTPRYKEFVELNADTIFTIEYLKEDKEKEDAKPHVVRLEGEIWNFSDVDLMVLDPKDEQFKVMDYIILDEKNESGAKL